MCCGEDITFNQVAKFTVPLQDVALFPGAGPPVNLPASPPVSRHFVILTDSSFLSYCQSQLFASNRTCVDESAPT
ncbi:hypothetical protein EA199_10660 [Escherichia coli]|nr:hypothetical protein EA199_10660 [Escherichia coli]